MKLEPGDVFGRYRIEAVLGQGGMGRVYRAYDTRLRRAVALKVLLVSTERTEAEARVLREARAAAALNHPEAVAIFDVGEATTPEGESVPYIAMELVVGRSLRVLAEDRQLGLASRLRWLASVARVLAAAHHLGLLHRDVKPENVVVRDDGAVRVLDFGLARQAVDEDPSRSPMAMSQALTGEGVILGTPLYMSPEQLRGDKLDARTDQFSWAVMAYEVLSGALPWKHKESVRVVAEILAVEPPPLRTLAPEVPADVAAVIEKALAKDPAKRLPTMDAIVEVLDAHTRGASGPSTASADVPITQPSVPAVRGRRTGLLLLAVGGVAAIALALVVLRDRSGTEPAPAPSTLAAVPSASTAPLVRLTDLPAPSSTSAEAVAAYLEGIRGQHDGLNDAYRGYDRAIALDPSMAAADERSTEVLVAARQYGIARDYYRRVLAYRDRLTEEDRAICSALEPGLVWDPVDWVESVRRLRILHEANPRDEYLLDLLGNLLQVTDPSPAGHAEARAYLEAAVRADPGFGLAWADLARLDTAEGHGVEARHTAETCLREAPRATDCLDALETQDSLDGNCRGVLSDGRRWIAISPDDRWGYFSVASALAALGEPWDSVEEAVSQAVERVVPEDRAARGPEWRASVAVLRGDFAAADASAQELGHSQAMTYDARDRAIVERVTLAMERGDGANAATLAGAYPRRRGAFAPPTFDMDPTPLLLDAERRGSALSATEVLAQMDRWRHDWKGRLTGNPPADMWTVGDARVVETHEEAERALLVRPPLDQLTPTLDPGTVGRVSLLAGRYEEAEPRLATAARSCFVLDGPFDVVHASLNLGLAREGRGDKDGACSAYRDVLARWGSARPRSVTAEKARERARSLHCPDAR